MAGKNLAMPTPLTIVFLGADGSGKTTLVKALSRAAAGETASLYLGEKHFYISFVEHVFQLKDLAAPRSLIRRLLEAPYRYVLLPLDIMCRSHSVRRSGKCRVILIDRVPGFPFAPGTRLLRAIYRWVLPKPDLVVFLHGDPVVLAARKPDATREGIARDCEKFRKVAHALGASKVLEIDTGSSDRSKTLERVTREMDVSQNQHRSLELR